MRPSPTRRSPSATWWLLLLLSIGVAGYASLALLRPEAVEFVAAREGPLRWLLIVHACSSALALTVGPAQFLPGLRARHPRWHRRAGRVYTAAVVIGAATGGWLAFDTRGGLPATVGFFVLSILWLGSTVTAVRAAFLGDLVSHRAWMLRSFALTFAAVTLRVFLGLGIAAGFGFEAVYATISWMSWVLNLLVVEWFLLPRPRSYGSDRARAKKAVPEAC